MSRGRGRGRVNVQQFENTFATPKPCDLGRSVRDFYSERDAVATPRRFITVSTPMSRRVNFAADLVAGLEEDEHKEHLDGLLGRSWQVYSVGPLFGFERDDFPKLSEFIKQSLPPSLQEKSVDVVQVETVMGVRGSREDSQAFKISVTRKSSGFSCVLFQAYFVSVDATDMDLVSSFTLLPVCLASGSEVFAETVFRCLRITYDTVITPLDFTQDDMQWMSALWANATLNSEPEKEVPTVVNGDSQHDDEGEETHSKPDQVKFRFRFPPRHRDCRIQTIDATMETKQVRKIWKSVHDENDVEFSLAEKTAFHQQIRDFIFDRTGVDIFSLLLSNFFLPVVSASYTGKIKMNCQKSVKAVLRFLTSKSQGDLVTAQPRLALREEPGNWESFAQE